MNKYFGTDGIRGEVGKFPITPEFVMRLGYAAGIVLGKLNKNNTVIIGKDSRLSGYLFESALEAGFSYAGVNVYMAGPVPTPCIAYLTQSLNLSAGVVISASHNLYMDNGIKFFSNTGNKLSDEIEAAIEKQLEEPMVMAATLGKVNRLNDAKERYINFCLSTVAKDVSLKGLRIVLDCANGATYQVAPDIFNRLGAQIVKVGCEPNGVNINDDCGSTAPDQLIKAVKENNADLGIAFDGDGDRVLFVDRYGAIYNGDKLIYIILKSYLAMGKNLPGIVGTVMTNIAMEHKLNSLRVELVRAKVGDRYVLEELANRGWTLGGEASGHILLLDKHTTGDGIISALQVLVAIIKLREPLDKLIDWEDYPQVIINVRLKPEIKDWQSKADMVIKDARLAIDYKGRIVIRPSGTEPVVRVMVEAVCSDLANKWALHIAEAIQTTDK